MTSDPAVYPTPAAHCRDCEFSAPCLAMIGGADPGPMLAADFHRRPAEPGPRPGWVSPRGASAGAPHRRLVTGECRRGRSRQHRRTGASVTRLPQRRSAQSCHRVPCLPPSQEWQIAFARRCLRARRPGTRCCLRSLGGATPNHRVLSRIGGRWHTPPGAGCADSALRSGPVVRQELSVERHHNAVARRVGFLRDVDAEVDRAHDAVAELFVDQFLDRAAIT